MSTVFAEPVQAAEESGEAKSSDAKSSVTPSADAPAAKEAPAKVQVARPGSLEELVRGLYIQMNIGPGYMVLNRTMDDPAFSLTNETEGLGIGSTVAFTLGYDVSDVFAIQFLGGMSFASTRRDDRMRDLIWMYGGVGARYALHFSERFHWVTSLGGVFGKADDVVDEAVGAPALLFNTGFEYYVHVRHFSVGVDLGVLAALAADDRVFLNATPYLKYTF
ncbi:adventurous gliding motility protein CglE [Myxococcota bacterium]|nr:adventurous gliding motility protein CglE [Myxococcota bacterium]